MKKLNLIISNFIKINKKLNFSLFKKIIYSLNFNLTKKTNKINTNLKIDLVNSLLKMSSVFKYLLNIYYFTYFLKSLIIIKAYDDLISKININYLIDI